jgi:hypothetical protein
MKKQGLMIIEYISFIPVVYFILYYIPFFRDFFNQTAGVLHTILFSLIILILLLAITLVIIGFFFFLKKKKKDVRDYLWLLLLFSGNVFTFPLYWYFFVIKEYQ